ncbi:LD-carboxypeptidase LdcB/DacB [Streptococcus agalactiae]|uniref:LD-carboxypeptidase LdcB/DacB n=1 Tax=Streptococcus agalactiae TaxID=1311 RepID=UPI00085C0957|nr:LD-carboxypeptidase LdcB/DacB [Streptococcus agalactiae]
MKREFIKKEKQRYSIRKYSFGATSVLIGATLMFGSQIVSADEMTNYCCNYQLKNEIATETANIVQPDLVITKDSETSTYAAGTTIEKISQLENDTSQVRNENATSSTEKVITNLSIEEEELNTGEVAMDKTDSIQPESVQVITDSLPKSEISEVKERVESEVSKISDDTETVPLPQTSERASGTVMAYKVATNNTKTTLPASGIYTFEKFTEIKNEASVSAPVQFYYPKGDKVTYDKLFSRDGHQWLSYVSYSGIRRFANLGKLDEFTTVNENSVSKVESQPIANKIVSDLAPSGSYTFKEDTNVKNEAKTSAPVQFYYPKGDKVNYDKVLVNEGHQWLSYISYSGTRRYADLGKINTKIHNEQNTDPTVINTEKNQVIKEIVKLDIPPKGTYRFDKTVSVKNEANISAPTQFNFYKGEGINYDTVMISDSHNWISYISYSGTRRYVDLGKVEIREVSKPTTANQTKANGESNVSSKSEIKVFGKILIENKTAQGFDVVISNVSSSEDIVDVRVPVWSTQGGQDDIIWNKASKQADGNYRTRVEVNQHKGNAGEYNIHLYYTLRNGKQRGVASTTTIINTAVKDVITGTIKVDNKTSQGFDVFITNVADSKGIEEVKVPIWSTQGGQDDLIWYVAKRQETGNYKVSVDIASHKKNTSEYNIHLYYLRKDGKLKGVAATTTNVNSESNSRLNQATFNGSYYIIRGKYDDIIIANKKYPMSLYYNPGENPKAKEAFLRLRNEMINQGFNVGTGYSGFRSYDNQKILYQNYANRDGYDVADRYSARAGYSEHQTGLAYDLTDKSGNLLEDKNATDWLQNNAHRYGFVVRYLPGKELITGYMSEPWHIRYIGKEAKEVYESGKTLEEYYGFDGGGYADNNNSSSSVNSSISIAPQGIYQFTKRSSIKAEPKILSPELAYYDAGNTVNYDKVVISEGHHWISYIAYSGSRRYIAID